MYLVIKNLKTLKNDIGNVYYIIEKKYLFNDVFE